MKIGILALQGAFIEHKHTLKTLGVESFEIRQRADFDQPLDGLIIPGGESTTITKLLYELALFEPINDAIKGGLATFGTCAGMILLSKKVSQGGTLGTELDSVEEKLPTEISAPALVPTSVPDAAPVTFAALDTTVQRNAYGRQLGSFHTTTHFEGIGEIPATFIRAPYVKEVWGEAEALARVDDRIVAVRQGRVLATAFHPELSAGTRVHEYFLAML